MRIIEISVNGIEIEVKSNQPLIAGSVGDVGCTFTFSPDWDPLTKVAVFTGGSESRSVILDGSTVEIPWETLQKEQTAYMIGVYGLDSGYLVRQTTPCLVGYVRCGSGTDAQAAAAPSPSLTQQLLEATQTAVRSAAAAVEQASILLRDGDGTRVLTDDGTYKRMSGGGAIPDALPNPHRLRFTGAVTAEYDGSEEIEVSIPAGSGGVAENAVTTAESIDDAAGEVVYIPGEEPDGSIADILKGYQRERDKLQVIFISTDDGVDGNISSDCTLVKTPSCNILVDIGRKSDYGTIRTAVLEAGVTRLDYIFLSHYHFDHCGCVSGLTGSDASNTSLSTLWADADIDTGSCVLILPYLGSVSDLKAGEQSEVRNIAGSIEAFAAANNVTTQVPAEGHYWNVSDAVRGEAPIWDGSKPAGKISVRAHNCSAAMHGGYDTGSSDYNTYTYNNFSTVLEIEHGHTLCTLTGDINVPAQTALYGILRQCDVYKVPHHAYEAAIYETLLDDIRPRYMVVNADTDMAESRIKSLDNATALWSHNNKVPLYLLCDSGTCVFESDGTKYELLTNNREYRQTFAERDWTRLTGVNLAATAVANAFVTKVYPELINANEVRFVTPNCNIGVMRDGINTINRCHYYFHNTANSAYDYHFDCYVNWSTGEVGLRQNLKGTSASLMVISDLLYR